MHPKLRRGWAAFPPAPSREQEVNVPSDSARAAETRRDHFARAFFGVEEMPDARIDYAARHGSSCFQRIPFDHRNPDDAHADVDIRIRVENNPLHRTGAFDTLGSGRRGQSQQPDFVPVAVEVVDQRLQCIDETDNHHAYSAVVGVSVRVVVTVVVIVAVAVGVKVGVKVGVTVGVGVLVRVGVGRGVGVKVGVTTGVTGGQ